MSRRQVLAASLGGKYLRLVNAIAPASTWMVRYVISSKELQSFKSERVLSLFNICTAVPKKIILDKSLTILAQAQSFAQKGDFTKFYWDVEDLPTDSTLPAMVIRLQNPKLPGQDTSNYSKLSWRVQANWKVYHVECNRRYAANIKGLAQVAKEVNMVTKCGASTPM
jgi:hypothetical protein